MNFLSPVFNEQTFDANGDPLVGGKLYTYAAGTSTPLQTYTTQSGPTQQTNPIILNARGEPTNPIWLLGSGQEYKFMLYDANNNLIRTVDDVGGVNDVTASGEEWIASSLNPTYISATSFSFAGDQTLTFPVGRRLKTTNSGGTVYSTITASVFSSGITTITITNDSGALDSGLSVVAYGILSPSNPSGPNSQEFRVSIGLPGQITHGRCRLSAQDSLLLILLPFDGNTIFINGQVATVPNGGVTLSSSVLNVSGVYYIYAYLNSGSLALEASTTIHVTDAATGVRIKYEDPTRSLVGIARGTVTGGPAIKLWSTAAGGVLSYFNRKEIVISNNFPSTAATTSHSYVEIAGGSRCNWLTWADEPVKFFVNGSVSNSGASVCYTSIGVDGTTAQDACSIMAGTTGQGCAVIHSNSFSEGDHYSTVLGRVTGGTGSWVGSATTGERTTHQAIVMG